MKVLVTGAKGFIGKNLIAHLENKKCHTIYQVDVDTPKELLNRYCRECGFAIHLAGVNRPKREEEFMEGNGGFTQELLDKLEQNQNQVPIVFSSSIQAELDNPYGKSKKYGEDLVLRYGERTQAPVFIYRFPNVFGKWCRPGYNSVVATFCSHIANGRPIEIHDGGKEIELVHIDDVAKSMMDAMEHWKDYQAGYCQAAPTYRITISELAETIRSFRDSRNKLYIPDMAEDGLVKKLYSTYLSYLPYHDLCHSLNMNRDERGSFTEVIKTPDRGQVSVNISHPGITRGNHWHHTKHEKFVVISGEGLIKLRQIHSEEIMEFRVSGKQLQAIDIPPGCTHSITNVGADDLVTLMWCNECFNPDKADTYFVKVDEEKEDEQA